MTDPRIAAGQGVGDESSSETDRLPTRRESQPVQPTTAPAPGQTPPAEQNEAASAALPAYDTEVTAAPLLERLAERLGGRATMGAVFGEPVVAEGVTVVPVAKVTFGIGGGGGRDRAATRNGEGLGAGAGTHARPVGFIEIREGRATFVPIPPQRPEALYGLAALIAALSAPRIIRALLRRG